MPDHPSIQAALSAVMADVRAVGKTGTNHQQNYEFRGIDDVMNAVGPALRQHQVVVLPALVDMQRASAQSRNGGPLNSVTVTVRYRFVGPAGDHLECTVAGEAFDSGDKATAKAFSVAYRIALLQALCLPTHEPDPDQNSYDATVPTLAQAKRQAWDASGHDQAKVTAALSDLGVQDPKDADVQQWLQVAEVLR